MVEKHKEVHTVSGFQEFQNDNSYWGMLQTENLEKVRRGRQWYAIYAKWRVTETF